MFANLNLVTQYWGLFSPVFVIRLTVEDSFRPLEAIFIRGAVSYIERKMEDLRNSKLFFGLHWQWFVKSRN